LPHRFVASFIYQFPSLKGHVRVLREVAGRWEINGIGTLQSGAPFTVTSGRDNSGTAINNDRPNPVGDWRLADGPSQKPQIQQYFNIAAFVQNPAGTFGNAGRNILRGPFRGNLDLGAIKNFQIAERHRVQFRAELFNLLNHANLGNPNGNLSNVQFGRITTA